MKPLRQILGKFSVPLIIGIAPVILIFVFISFLKAGWAARDAHDRISVGMRGSEVQSVLSRLGKYNIVCETDLKAKIFDDRQCFQTIELLPGQQQIRNVKMKVLFMGPVFWHNDFSLTFGPDGKVHQISPVRGWE